MAQSNIITRERATYLGEESAFGTTPAGSFPNAMTRAFPLGDGLILEGLAEEMLAVGDERVRRLDAIHPVHGLRIASKVGALKMLLKSTKAAAQLVDGATPNTYALTPRLVLSHALGSEWANEGDVITGASSTVSILYVTDASRFLKGSFIAVEVSGQMEWAKILNTDTGVDTLTIAPDLSGAPTAGAIVRNLYSYAPAETLFASLTVQQAFVGDATAQVTASGCYGDVSFDLPEFGKLPSMSLALTATNFTGPSSQSLGVASASDEMGPAFAWAPSVYLATSVDRATRLVCEGATIEYANDWQMVRDPGATQTVSAVVATGGRPTAVKASIKLRFDSAYKTGFTQDTAYQMIIVQRIGTGIGASFWIWELPAARLVAQPKLADMGSRLHMELALEGIQDTTVTLAGESGGALDFIVAPFRVAFG